MIVGIDLGTTNSALAYYDSETQSPRLVQVDNRPIMPSVVSYLKDGEVTVGQNAANRYIVEPESTFREIKRFMGVQRWFHPRGREVNAIDIQAEILKKLVACAEEETGETIAEAVITVPAYFSQTQREHTFQAAKQAGLKCQRLINEPTAASFAYFPKDDKRRSVLVYDLGGGTFDVSLVSLDQELVEVRASHGDTKLGGRDFDELLKNWIIEQFIDSVDDCNEAELREHLEESAGLQARTTLLAEKAKIELSSQFETQIREEFFCEFPTGTVRNIDLTLDRASFEHMIRFHIDKTLDSVREVLDASDCSIDDVDEILLVGGSSRIPLITELLAEELGKRPHFGVNPDECVALGAAVQAARLSGLDVQRVCVDVLSHSLGVLAMIELDHMGSNIIIERNTPLPHKMTRRYWTNFGAAGADICILQGDNPNPFENIIVGEVLLDDLAVEHQMQQMPILITLQADLSGIIKITAEAVNDQISESIEVDQTDKGIEGLVSRFFNLLSSDIRPCPPGVSYVETERRFRVWQERHMGPVNMGKELVLPAPVSSPKRGKKKAQAFYEQAIFSQFRESLSEIASDFPKLQKKYKKSFAKIEGFWSQLEALDPNKTTVAEVTEIVEALLDEFIDLGEFY